MRKVEKKKINRKLRAEELYDNSLYIGNLCVQTKLMVKTKQNFLPPSTPVTVFLIADNY